MTSELKTIETLFEQGFDDLADGLMTEKVFPPSPATIDLAILVSRYFLVRPELTPDSINRDKRACLIQDTLTLILDHVKK